jgi:transposase-like protein
MRKGARLSQSEKLKIVQSICDEYASGDFTIESCCKANGISWATFWQWCNNEDSSTPGKVNELNELYKEAQKEKDRAYRSRLKQLARTALEKRVAGYDVEVIEVTEETINDDQGNVLSIQKVRTKKTDRHIPPDVRAVMFTLGYVDGKVFPEFRHTTIDFSNLTEEEQQAILERIAQKIKNDE